MLKISPDLELPIAAVTEPIGILAVRRAGKSNAAVVMAEEMSRHHLHWVAIDPKGDWYGLRSSHDGKGPGLPVPIFGGRHGDVPLEPGGGAVIADLIVDQTITCVLDVSGFASEADKIRFLLAFSERLFRRKNETQDPTHVFFEEADDYIPQRAFPEQARLVHSMARILKQGGSRGLGGTVISQRSAVVHKDVLTQIQTLFALRTTSPQDRKAIQDWVSFNGENTQIVADLPGLADGEAWVWSPNWLRMTKRIRFRQRHTFDSGATPVSGKTHRAAPATLADIDLGAIQQRMADTIERAKADDPNELKKKLAEKDKRIKALELATSAFPPSNEGKKPEVTPALTEADRELLRSLQADFTTFSADISDRADAVLQSIADRAKAAIDEAALRWTDQVDQRRALFINHLGQTRVQRVLDKIDGFTHSRNPGMSVSRPASQSQHGAGRATATTPATGSGDLTGPEQRILDALAWLAESVGNTEPELAAVAFLAGYTVDGGAFNNPKGKLRGRGFIEYLGGGRLALTDAGRDHANAPSVPLTSDELHARVLARLPGPEQRLLKPLLEVYPRSLTNIELADRAGYTPNAGAFNNPRGRLRSLGLIEYPQPGCVVAKSLLFPGETR